MNRGGRVSERNVVRPYFIYTCRAVCRLASYSSYDSYQYSISVRRYVYSTLFTVVVVYCIVRVRV